MCKLRTNEIVLVKVLLRNQFIEETTSGAEHDMKKRYPHLFKPRETLYQGTNSQLNSVRFACWVFELNI